eukprot:TRINITY_DN11473_c1_g3_i1.p1 TRINITY_DN11473_c1_g3~~TRINITY_DN11473_c1_g3_i1.p1  ORF type:complete len:130 (-),score=0.62 TRINITY_DN11473_c1_g3_i1:324-713(-)
MNQSLLPNAFSMLMCGTADDTSSHGMYAHVNLDGRIGAIACLWSTEQARQCQVSVQCSSASDHGCVLEQQLSPSKARFQSLCVRLRVSVASPLNLWVSCTLAASRSASMSGGMFSRFRASLSAPKSKDT